MRRKAFFVMAMVAALGISMAADDGAGQRARGTVVARPADGFSMTVPSGWKEAADASVALSLVRTDQSGASAVVIVQRESAPTAVTDTLAKVSVRIGQEEGNRTISSDFDVVLDRPAVVAVFEDQTTRYRAVVVPRELGETSQVYYIVIAGAPKAQYAKLRASIEAVAAGLAITDVAPAARAATGRTLAAPAPAGGSGARDAAFEAVLSPLGPGASTPAAAGAKDQKRRTEALAAFDKGLVFARQQAWKEAEKAFRDAEKRDDKDEPIVFAVAYVYLQLHRPDDALKRYKKFYEKDPGNTKALVGMAASYEEAQNYREAVKMWQRYTRMELSRAEMDAGVAMLRGAQELFAERYEIAENPGGGATNAATTDQELAWGLDMATQLAGSGIPLVKDREVNAYVQDLCQRLVARSKNFPTNYELFVLDSAVVNAQTTPGFIFVYRGILEASDTEAELAGVLAHEIGHSVGHHIGKMQTKLAQDQQTLESLQGSDNRLAKFLASMLAAGNPLGALSFNREQEEQADRLAVHIAYDAGFDPRGLASMFQKFESAEPSSRKSWDLMTRTHPFSIDRVNAVNEYAALLPERSLTTTSPAFTRMKARLAALPPPEDQTGLMKPAVAPEPPSAPPAPSSGAGGGTTPFTIDGTPFAGVVPAGWVARKTDGGTVVFEGAQGTEAYQASVELEVAPKANINGQLDDVAQVVYGNMAKRDAARVEAPERRSAGDIPARIIRGSFRAPMSGRSVDIRQMSIVLDFPEHFIVFSYYIPAQLFDKYMPQFQQIVEQFEYRGR